MGRVVPLHNAARMNDISREKNTARVVNAKKGTTGGWGRGGGRKELESSKVRALIAQFLNRLPRIERRDIV